MCSHPLRQSVDMLSSEPQWGEWLRPIDVSDVQSQTKHVSELLTKLKSLNCGWSLRTELECFTDVWKGTVYQSKAQVQAWNKQTGACNDPGPVATGTGTTSTIHLKCSLPRIYSIYLNWHFTYSSRCIIDLHWNKFFFLARKYYSNCGRFPWNWGYY